MDVNNSLKEFMDGFSENVIDSVNFDKFKWYVYQGRLNGFLIDVDEYELRSFIINIKIYNGGKRNEFECLLDREESLKFAKEFSNILRDKDLVLNAELFYVCEDEFIEYFLKYLL